MVGQQADHVALNELGNGITTRRIVLQGCIQGEDLIQFLRERVEPAVFIRSCDKGRNREYGQHHRSRLGFDVVFCELIAMNHNFFAADPRRGERSIEFSRVNDKLFLAQCCPGARDIVEKMGIF